ncbi:MAG: hypothetical protein QXZ44_03300 [Ferroplasma sp.]
MDRNMAIQFLQDYVNRKYISADNIKIRELKYDKYTYNWTGHVSFSDIDRSYELAIIFNGDKIVFAKEFI